MVALKPRKSNKNPPILSHEFVIQNHADIVSCVAMVFVVGLLVQVTSPYAYIFIAVQHNVTNFNADGTIHPMLKYTTGWKDACAVFFYFLITIVMHAVVQEYILDKVSKRYRLSKTKLSRFNESSQLIIFYALSVAWGADIIIRDNFVFNAPSLWNGYPQPMSFSLKLFFIGQLAYWLHCYPELYFQRAKKEEIPHRVFEATIGLIYTLGAYILNFQHVGVALIVAHHMAEGMMHVAKLCHFINQKEKVTQGLFFVAKLLFVFARVFSVLVFGLFAYGLTRVESRLNIAEGKFNIPAITFSAAAAFAVFQFYLTYVFAKYHRERSKQDGTPSSSKVKVLKQKPKRKEASKKSGGSEDEQVDSDYAATRKSPRFRNATKTK